MQRKLSFLLISYIPFLLSLDFFLVIGNELFNIRPTSSTFLTE